MAANANPEGVFDRAALLERSRGDRQLMQQVLASFLAEAQASLRALRGASERGNLRYAEEFAFTLRLAAANAGATEVARAAAEIASAAARAGDVESAPTAASLGPCLARLEEVLLRFREGVADQLDPSP